ncbi:MAG TPA: hypothetical protein EYG71_05245 [Leucothrix sp.]|nr:hypothetical protein [Leucothrix sp.]
MKIIIPTIALCLALSTGAMAKSNLPQLPQPSEEQFYYEIGAGTDFRVSGGIEVPKELMMMRDFGLLIGDGSFDPSDSIKATLKGIISSFTDLFKKKVKGLLNIGNITSTITNLPGYIFCQANPTGCQLNENYTIRAEEKERYQRRFYERMEAELAQSRGKLDGWLRAGKANHLVKVMNDAKKSGEKDLEMIVGKIRDYTGEQGLKWMGGTYAGGTNQPPIRPIADTAKAGFNLLLGRSATASTKASGKDPLLDYWDTPEEAAKWITEVVGEYRPDLNNKNLQKNVGGTRIGSDDGDGGLGGEDVVVTAAFMNSDSSTPAMGLSPKSRKESLSLQKKIKALVDSKSKPTIKQLTQIMGKSSSMIITPKLLNILRNSPIESQLIQQISDDAAQASTIRYALEARRLLLAGRNEPHIAAYEVATKDIDQRAKILTQYIDDMLYERKVSNTLLSQTLLRIYQHADAIRSKYATPDKYNTGSTLLEGARGK